MEKAEESENERERRRRRALLWISEKGREWKDQVFFYDGFDLLFVFYCASPA